MQINVVKQNVETPFAGVGLLLSVFRKSVPGAFKSLSVMHSCAGTRVSKRAFIYNRGSLASLKSFFEFPTNIQSTLWPEQLHQVNYTKAAISKVEIGPSVSFFQTKQEPQTKWNEKNLTGVR